MLFVFLFIIAIIAFALSTLCGGGASFILLPAIGLVIPGTEIPGAISIGTTVSSVSRIAAFYRHIRWDIVKYFVPFALPGVWLGARVLSMINPVWLEFVIGLFLVANIPYLFKSNKADHKPGKRWHLMTIGLATGFLSGLTGAVGLLFNRFYLTYGLTKEQIVATRAANELLLHIVKIILYSLLGLFSSQSISVGLLIAIAAIIATVLATRLLHKLSDNLFRKIGFAAMALSGFVMLGNSGWSLYANEGLQFVFSNADNNLETKVLWQKRSFAIEFEYDKGFEYERSVDISALPAQKQLKVKELTKGTRILLIEEVYNSKTQFYEVYFERNGKKEKREF